MLALDKEDLKTSLSIRQKLNKLFQPKSENQPGDLGYQPIPSSSSKRKYLGGISTNWSAFYRPTKITGLDLETQVPFFDNENVEQKMFGLTIPMEDVIIIFRANDQDIGVYIMSGSSKIDVDKLASDAMYAGRLL